VQRDFVVQKNVRQKGDQNVVVSAMPDPAPDGVLPIFLRGVTAEKYGFKTGEGVMDLVDYKLLNKEEVTNEIVGLGVMSDFEPAKKQIASAPGEELLVVVDKEQKYGEIFLIIYTQEAHEEFMNKLNEEAAAIEAQKQAERDAEEARIAAEHARANIVFDDKPIEARPWVTETGEATVEEVDTLTHKPSRVRVQLSITRAKRNTMQPTKFLGRDASVSGIGEFKSYKDPNFIPILENDIGLQAAPFYEDVHAQTTWFRTVNKAIQPEPLNVTPDVSSLESRKALCTFLEDATMKVEKALQQNETIDIFHDTFSIHGTDDGGVGDAADNELRELKNFADPNYTKNRALVALDWVPKAQGMIGASGVRNISFDERAAVAGQSVSAYILLWDFRQLVRPQLLMQCPHDVLAFRFNGKTPGVVVGGCITGQVVLWDITAAMSALSKKSSNDDEGKETAQLTPKYVSHVDHSHKRPVADLYWLPPTTQINFRGQLVADEHLTDEQFQFLTVSGDGHVMVWDTRYEQIFNDELRHIARPKHVPVEKVGNKDSKDGGLRPLWAPIYNAHVKRPEGVGELSLNKVSLTGLLKDTVTSGSELEGDPRSRLLLTTEEGDLLHVDICATKKGADDNKKHDDEHDDDHKDDGRDYVKWMAPAEHQRPCVYVAQSPFFPDIVVTVSDWRFHIWKVGVDQPLFVSPTSRTYMTSGAWSPTRPAVLIVGQADGELMAWDFTDSSYRPSIELKATPSKISSLEFLKSTTSSRHQLLAVGVDIGTLQVFELPRNLVRPVPNEESIMKRFLERELVALAYIREHKTEVDENESNLMAAGRPDTAGGMETDMEEDEEAVDPEALAKEAILKEMEEFDKLEAQFVAELQLTEVPAFAQKHVDAMLAAEGQDEQ